jgi:hypothetical protein
VPGVLDQKIIDSTTIRPMMARMVTMMPMSHLQRVLFFVASKRTVRIAA